MSIPQLQVASTVVVDSMLHPYGVAIEPKHRAVLVAGGDGIRILNSSGVTALASDDSLGNSVMAMSPCLGEFAAVETRWARNGEHREVLIRVFAIDGSILRSVVSPHPEAKIWYDRDGCLLVGWVEKDAGLDFKVSRFDRGTLDQRTTATLSCDGMVDRIDGGVAVACSNGSATFLQILSEPDDLGTPHIIRVAQDGSTGIQIEWAEAMGQEPDRAGRFDLSPDGGTILMTDEGTPRSAHDARVFFRRLSGTGDDLLSEEPWPEELDALGVPCVPLFLDDLYALVVAVTECRLFLLHTRSLRLESEIKIQGVSDWGYISLGKRVGDVVFLGGPLDREFTVIKVTIDELLKST